ncbi:MAG: histidine phosphatase family protein [Propioniciclava sp.]|uniref:2-carboxy-D-arabinitol-1-phosphatase n=1 Tax=Propioniciclava sp. TaxID=2038686 RepID=UPI0039E6F5BC
MRILKSAWSAILCVLVLVFATACTPPAPNEPSAGDATDLRFYLVRHGQTYTNIKEMSIASAGSAPLTEKGRAFAYYAGLGLAQEKVEFLATYSSPLNRTHETAEYLLAGLGVQMPITVEENVRDINWGVMEAAYPEEYPERYGHEGNDYNYFLGKVDQKDFVSPVEGAETTYQFAQRYEEGLKNIASQHQGKKGNILVASHSTIGFYATKFTGADPHGVPNTSVTIVEYKDGKFSLVEEGITSFMENGEKLYGAKKDLEIHLVTSPQTLLQGKNLIEGGVDSNLVEAGEKAAAKIPDAVGGTPAAIYSSDQGRSRAARAIAYPDQAKDAVEDARLNELFLGYWEGEKIATLQNSAAADLALLRSPDGILRLTPREGEGEYPMLAAGRLQSMLKDIALRYQASEGKVVVFTHPYLIKSYLNAFFPDYRVPVSDKAQVLKLTYKSNQFKVGGMTEIEP